MRDDLPTGTVTFVFTDVEGSTQLLEQIGDEAYDGALAEHRRVVRAACAATGGVEVDTQGDAFFFAFPTAPGALAAASQMTRALASGPIRLRIGLHTGEPRLSEEGYVGKEVHFAARVAASGHGGQIIFSKATAELVDGSLTDLGEHRLKDIAEAVAIYQLGEESFPPLKTISNTNLPRPASSFVGRAREQEEVVRKLQSGARLLTLTGPGGSGKTRLALEAAAELVPAYNAGVFWVGLASLRDPALVTETIARTLGAKDGLHEHIADREMLLLLDNLEQVVDAAPELASLLATCPNLTLLVTSRELLRVQGEVEYPVPPLASPEAVSLFSERAQLEPSEDMGQLCARLDNLPLAVELAAARTKALSVSQILERLSQRLDLLKGGRDSDPRQQTLRATIEWSYDLLSRQEQALFARLSVFAGGCTLEAAEEVADADLDTVQSLVEKSLLRFTNGRYWMLETIREYAGERLEEAGEAEAARERHADVFADLARRGDAELSGSSHREWTDRFEAERDNLRSAMTWSFGIKRVERAYELAIAYGALCIYRGPLTEGRSWLNEALRESEKVAVALRQKALGRASNLAERQGDLEPARTLAEESLALAHAIGDSETIGAALLQLGIIECDAGNFDRGEALQREAVDMFATNGNEGQLRHALGMLGFLLIARGSYSEAREVCEEALNMSRAAGDSRSTAVASSNLGHVLARQGSVEEALRLQREALLISHELHDIQGAGEVLLDIAALAVSRRDYVSAGALLRGVASLAESNEFALVSVQVESFDETLDVVRQYVAADELDRIHARVSQMPFDEIVTHAVEFIDSQV